MEMMTACIETEATGKRMKELLKKRGYKVADVKDAMGFSNPQAIYKWFKGETLPSIDNLVRFSLLVGVKIDDILVIDNDEDFCHLRPFFFLIFSRSFLQILSIFLYFFQHFLEFDQRSKLFFFALIQMGNRVKNNLLT